MNGISIFKTNVNYMQNVKAYNKSTNFKANQGKEDSIEALAKKLHTMINNWEELYGDYGIFRVKNKEKLAELEGQIKNLKTKIIKKGLNESGFNNVDHEFILKVVDSYFRRDYYGDELSKDNIRKWAEMLRR